MPCAICVKLHLKALFLPTLITATLHGGAGLAIWFARLRRGADLFAWPLAAAFATYLAYLFYVIRFFYGNFIWLLWS